MQREVLWKDLCPRSTTSAVQKGAFVWSFQRERFFAELCGKVCTVQYTSEYLMEADVFQQEELERTSMISIGLFQERVFF